MNRAAGDSPPVARCRRRCAHSAICSESLAVDTIITVQPISAGYGCPALSASMASPTAGMVSCSPKIKKPSVRRMA